FRLASEYAGQAGSGGWAILSAKFGLIRPGKRIGFYDTTINRSDAVLAIRVRRQLLREYPGVREIRSLAGARYNEILEMATAGRDVRLVFPLAGLGLFARLRWLKARCRHNRR